MGSDALVATVEDSRTEHLRRFGEAIDAIRTRLEAKIGQDDLRYIRRVEKFSRLMEVAGRGLIHLSFEPIAFTLGVLALFIHKQLQATEIGHTTLHGAFDKIPGADEFRSKDFYWELPIDEESWRYGHNVRHHGNTNIAGKDPDIHFGPVRLTEQTPYAKQNRGQLFYALLFLAPNFGMLMNAHFTGLVDYYFGNGRHDEFDFIADRSRKTAVEVHKKAFGKYLRFFFVEYVFFPALAGPYFWKVMLGNFISSTMRDIYSAATIYCGHVGGEVASYPEGARAKGRGAFYKMQAEASNNFEVSLPVSMLCGALDHQIEHHMFPRMPTNRLREIAPEVRAVCAEYGVTYRSESWGRTLRKALAHVAALSREEGAHAVVREMA
jgi:NADPH-dependent stearoyl-CoA 9-desaturase